MLAPSAAAAGAVVLVPRAVEPHLELVRAGRQLADELPDRPSPVAARSVAVHVSLQSAAQPSSDIRLPMSVTRSGGSVWSAARRHGRPP